MSRCKYSVKECSSGWLFDEDGVFLGRCQCKIDEYKEVYFDWSETPNKKRYMKTNDELDMTFPIYFNMEGDKAVDFKEEINLLVRMKDELLDKGIVLLKGLQGTGKTQFATTLAQSIFADIDWHVEDDDLELNPYYFLNLNEMMLHSVFFDKERFDIIKRKIKNANILILDEFGDELNKREGDGKLAMALDFLKEILDKFEGLIILTSNNIHIEQDYLNKTGRLDIHSRLFGDMEHRENVLVYGFQFADGSDLRDLEKRNQMKALKNRF